MKMNVFRFVVVFSGLFFTTIAFSQTNLNPKAGKKDLVIAVYQELGGKKQLPRVLSLAREALKNWTNFEFVANSQVEKELGQFGLDKLSKCFGKVSCLLEKSKSIQAKKALYLSVGVLGKRMIVQFVILDLEKKAKISSIQKNFKDMQDFEKKIKGLVVQLFPDFAKLVVEGSPKGAQVYINKKLRGNLPTKKITLPAKAWLKLEVRSPGYSPQKQEVILKPNQHKTLKIQLQKLQLGNVTKPKKGNNKGKSSIIRKWWFWTAIVGGSAVVATGVAVGVTMTSQNQKVIKIPF